MTENRISDFVRPGGGRTGAGGKLKTFHRVKIFIKNFFHSINIWNSTNGLSTILNTMVRTYLLVEREYFLPCKDFPVCQGRLMVRVVERRQPST